MSISKTTTQEATDLSEAERLRLKIIAATDGIPRHIMNGPHQLAAAFKEHAEKARKLAMHQKHGKSASKMREAWGLISGYYAREGF